MDRICFERPTFNMYLFILVCVVSYLAYFRWSQVDQFHASFDPEQKDLGAVSKDELYNKVIDLKDQLHESNLKEQNCQIQLNSLHQTRNVDTPQISRRFLDKIYNPLAPPENVYPGGNFNSRGYDGYQQFQMIGYLNGSQGQFPVFGRYKYPGKTDKMEYYTINEGRGRIKIPFKTKNYNELYDGDSIDISELGGEYAFRKYEDEGLRYNPNL
jgi:hypothetical protein